MSTLNWQYVGVSRKNGNVILFANGQKEAEGAFSGNLEQTSWGTQGNLVLGHRFQGGNGCRNGTTHYEDLRVLKNYGTTTAPAVPIATHVVPAQ